MVAQQDGLTAYKGQGNAGGYKIATQTSGFGFGIGGPGLSGQCYAGSGSGYYGGASSTVSPCDATCGGSSFISGHNGCDAIAENSTSSKIIHTGQANHYSGLVFTNTIMIDGEGYNWTNVKGNYVGQIQPDGTMAKGHAGNGYARITCLN